MVCCQGPGSKSFALPEFHLLCVWEYRHFCVIVLTKLSKWCCGRRTVSHDRSFNFRFGSGKMDCTPIIEVGESVSFSCRQNLRKHPVWLEASGSYFSAPRCPAGSPNDCFWTGRIGKLAKTFLCAPLCNKCHSSCRRLGLLTINPCGVSQSKTSLFFFFPADRHAWLKRFIFQQHNWTVRGEVLRQQHSDFDCSWRWLKLICCGSQIVI